MKFKRILSSLVLAVLLLALFAGTVLAAWGFAFPVNVVDTGGSARTYVPVLTGITGSSLNDSGYITATGTDTNMQIGSTSVAYMLSTTQIATVVPVLGAGSQAGLKLYTGYSPAQTAFSIIVGEDGYITVSDDADLELGDDFEIEFDGYIDTDYTAGKNFIYKYGAFRVYVQDDEAIRVAILQASSSSSETLRPDGVGDETNIPSVSGASTHWEATSDDSDSSYVYMSNSAAYVRDLYTCADTTGNQEVISVVINYRIRHSDAGQVASGKPCLKIGGTAYDGNEQSVTGTTWATKTQTYTQSPATSENWTLSEIDGMQIGISLKSTTGAAQYQAQCSDVWVTVNWGDETEATVTGVSSGEHTIKVYADGADLGIIVDEGEAGEVTDTTALSGSSVTDNSNDWIINQNNAMPYFDFYKHTIPESGTLIAWYQPIAMLEGDNYSTGTATFTNGSTAVTGSGTTWTEDMEGGLISSVDDASIWFVIDSVDSTTGLTLTENYSDTGGGGHDYLITVRLLDRQGDSEDGGITWGSNTDITVTMGSVESYESPEAGEGEQEEISYDVPAPNIPSGWFGSGDDTTLPFYDNFLGISTETGIPVKTIYVFMIFAVALAMGFGTFIVFKPMIFGLVVTLAVLWMGSSMGIIPGWVIFSLIVVGFGVIYMRRNM